MNAYCNLKLFFQVKTNFRTAITIPEKSWSRFRDIFSDYVDKMKEGGGGGASGGDNGASSKDKGPSSAGDSSTTSSPNKWVPWDY